MTLPPEPALDTLERARRRLGWVALASLLLPAAPLFWKVDPARLAPAWFTLDCALVGFQLWAVRGAGRVLGLRRTWLYMLATFPGLFVPMFGLGPVVALWIRLSRLTAKGMEP